MGNDDHFEYDKVINFNLVVNNINNVLLKVAEYFIFVV